MDTIKTAPVPQEESQVTLDTPQLDAQQYEAPKLKRLGTVTELTLGPAAGVEDGFGTGLS